MIAAQNADSVSEAAAIIARGGVIAFRTDTFYGLGADPFNHSAVKRVNELKGREGKPILVLISDRDQLENLIVDPSETYKLIAEAFWPGPLTLIGKAKTELSSDLTAGTGTVGIRLPDQDDARDLIRACGGALTATSANPSGQPPSRSAQDVEKYFSNGIDLIIDGGEVSAMLPSTVLDLSGPQPQIVREGAISTATIMKALSPSPPGRGLG